MRDRLFWLVVLPPWLAGAAAGWLTGGTPAVVALCGVGGAVAAIFGWLASDWCAAAELREDWRWVGGLRAAAEERAAAAEAEAARLREALECVRAAAARELGGR